MSNNHRTVKNVTQGVLKEVLGVFGEIINEVKKK